LTFSFHQILSEISGEFFLAKGAKKKLFYKFYKKDKLCFADFASLREPFISDKFCFYLFFAKTSTG